MDDAKIKKLEQKINAHKEAKIQRTQELNEKFHSNGAFKILVDILSGIAVGVFLGYILDSYMGTLPFWLFILSVFGMMGGLYNVYRDAVKLEKEEGKEGNE